MASFTPDQLRHDLWTATHDFSAGGQTYKWILLNTSYVMNKSHGYMSNLKSPTDYELASYTRQAVTGRSVNIDSTAHQMYLSATNPVFTGINSGTIGYVGIIRDRGGADSANEVIVICDPADLLTTGSDVTVVIDTLGIYRL